MSRASKRPADDDDGSLDASLSDDPPSSPPSGSRKRQRTSDNDVPDIEDGEREDTPPSDYDFEEDEQDELVATQAIREKRAQQGTNEPAECGILVNVELFNFMCHEHMIYELGPLINFICGKNGSGKSAILTAIVICLGGKASSTNRGGSLKSFIKEGQESSRIICRIKNEGDNAYMWEDYGNMIEIERYFSKQGSSGFKLKNERGRTVSTKKMDLEEICDYFGLQIDNPLNVLSQDMARQFLSDANASEKYKFFVKGVQLEQLDQDYRLIEEQLDNIEANIDKKKPDIEILERNMMKAKARDDAMKKKDQLRERMRDLRRQIAWIQVEEQEKLLDDFTKGVAEADEKISQAEKHVADLDEIFQASDATNEEAKASFISAQQAVQTAEDEKKEREAKRNEVKQEVTDAMTDLRAIKSALTNTDQDIKKTTDRIQKERDRLAEVQGGGAVERLNSLAEARQNHARAQQVESEAKDNLPNLHRAESQASDALKDLAKRKDEKQGELKKMEASLQDILKDHDKLELNFGPTMPALLQAIQQEKNQFHTLPVGPMGNHIRLIKPEWSSIIERSIGAALGGFVVTGKHDSDVLARIMRRVRCQTPILIVSPAPLQNIASNEPDEKFDTVLRILEIDNDLIKKQLILQNAIEQNILIQDLEEASRTMYEGGRLVNVKRCFCLNPHNKRSGYNLSYTATGQPRQDPIAEFVGRPRMKSDNQSQVQMRREAVQECKDRLHAATTEFYQAREAEVKAKQAVQKATQHNRNLTIERQQWEDKVSELVDATGNDQVDEAPLRALEEALAGAQVQKGLHEESYKDAVVSSDEKKARLSQAQKEVEVHDKTLKALERQQQKAQQAAARADEKRTYDLREKNAAIANISDAHTKRDTLEQTRIDQELRIEDYKAQAMEICQRVNVDKGRDTASLMTEHDEIRKDLERYRRQMGGTEEEIANAYLAARSAFKTGKRDLLHLESVATKLKGSLQDRRERWKKFRSMISIRAKAQFTYLLSERSFRGKLIADHKQKLLELRVEPDITKRDGQGRNTRTLSGGEKSFSQICLLLAIWEAMGSPIRCLDEFDVFMDPVNRNLSVNLLIEAARQSIGRQFILISPGTKNDIQRAPDIRAKEIAAPERGQRTLAFPIAA